MWPCASARVWRVFSFVFLTVLSPVPSRFSFAQPPEVPTFEGEEVVVSGRRPERVATSPAYVTVLLGSELRRLGLRTVGEALRYLAEVTVQENYGGPGGLLQPYVRGSSPQRVLVLLDGVPLNATAQLGVNLATLSLAEVERVEVLRGPYSAIWGSGLGGVIHVVTRPADRLRLRVAYGGAQESVVALSAGVQAERARYSLGVEHLGSAGYQPNADASRWTGILHLGWEPSPRSRWSLQVHHTAAQYGLPGATNWPGYPQPDRMADRRTVLQLAWQQPEEGGTGQQLRVWWIGDGWEYSSPIWGVSSAYGEAYGVTLQRTFAAGAGFVTVGGEYLNSSYRLASTFSTAQVAAGFLQYDLPVGDRTALGLGARYDLHSAYGGQLNPRLGFVHFLTDALRLRGGVGWTYRAPTFAELYFPGCSDPNLLPESTWSVDLGLEYSPRPGLVWRVNGFSTDGRIIQGGCPPTNTAARVNGLSAELSGRPAEGWQLLANLTWQDGWDPTKGERLLRVPTWTANLVLRRELDPTSAVAVLASFVGERDDLEWDFSTFRATRVTLPGYVTFALRYELTLADLVVSLGLDNLLDARYETLRGYPAPGRTVFVQVASRR
jgi:vitamin B12 transporter